VAILPYIDQKELYDKFKRNEPWDSPHNKSINLNTFRALITRAGGEVIRADAF
jgi:Protein of unknown function (DUF1559)